MANKPPMQISDYVQTRMLGPKATNDFILEKVKINQPFFVSRFGGVEGKIVNSIILKRDQEIEENLRLQARINAGINPPNRLTIKKFATEALCAAFKVDLMAIWNYPAQSELASYVSCQKYTYLNSIEPFRLYKDETWYP